MRSTLLPAVLAGLVIAAPVMSIAQVPTTQNTPGATPLGDSRSDSQARGGPGTGPVGAPMSGGVPTTRNTPGATPLGDSRSDSQARGGPGTGPVGEPMSGGVPTTQNTRGATPMSDSRTDSQARGGPGMHPVTRHRRLMRSKHAVATPASARSGGRGVVLGRPGTSRGTGNGAFLNGGGVFERQTDGSLRQVQP